VFTFATWEESYTGALILGPVNGPTEGLFLSMSMCLVDVCIPGFWNTKMEDSFAASVFDGTRFASYTCIHFIFCGLGAGAVVTILDNIRTVARVNNLLTAFSRLTPFVLMGAASAVWVYFSPSQIFLLHPRIFIFMSDFLFCILVTKLIVANLCQHHYSPYRPIILPLLLGACNALIPPYFFQMNPIIPEIVSLYALFFFYVVAWFHLIVNVALDTAGHLNINCFSIPLLSETSTQTSPQTSPTISNRKKIE